MTSLTPVRSAEELISASPDGVFLIRTDCNGLVHAHSRESGLIDGRHTARSFFGSHSDEEMHLGLYSEAERLPERCSAESLESLEDSSIVAFGDEIAPFLAYHKIEEDLFVEITDGSDREFESAEDLLRQVIGSTVVLLSQRSEKI